MLILPFYSINAQQSFEKFSDQFVNGYTSLHIPDLDLSYVNDFKQIKSADSIQKQLDFFRSVKSGLAAFRADQLNPRQKQDFDQIRYETELNLERLNLERQWVASRPGNISHDGLATIPNGKAWYAYLLKKWVSDDVTPDQIYQLGLNEIKRVNQHIDDIRIQTGMNLDAFYRHLNDSDFFISDTGRVQQSFEQTKKIISNHLDRIFYAHSIPDVSIKKGQSAALSQTPGYYDGNVFYYNLFGKPYDKRQIDWLFIHEAIPGHHYQRSIYAQETHSKVQKLFYYLGLSEGWAAYTEELGKELGVYRTPYDELGKWEWDIVRSVRVPMDVGINYYGWSDQQALAFWKQHIRNQDDIAMREIARVRRWPAQVVTYKYGALQIMRWKEILQKKQGERFSIKDFHDRILGHGSLPLFMVKENVLKAG